MKKWLQEYGRFAIAVIALSGFFFLLGILLSDEDTQDSIKYMFSKNSQDSTALFEDENIDYTTVIVGDTIESDTVPYFKVDDNVNFSIVCNSFLYSDALKYVHPYYKGIDISNKTKTDDNKDIKLTILAYEYKPVIEKSENDINGHVVMEEVFAKDKYNHYIYAEDGVTKLTTWQPKYDISEGAEFTSNSYIDTDVSTYKVKLVYRLQVGTYKAECEAFYIKNKDGVDVPTLGLSKINFVYE